MSVIIEGVNFPASCAVCALKYIVETQEMHATIYEKRCSCTGRALTFYGKLRPGLDVQRMRDCPLKDLDVFLDDLADASEL